MSQGSFDTLGSLKAVFVADVSAALKAMDSFGAKLQGVTEQAGAQLGKIGKSFEFLNTLVGAGIAAKGFEQFKELDKSMNELASSLGKTNAEFTQTRSAIVQFANDAKVPVQTLTEAMRRFTVVGEDVPTSMNLAIVSMRGAKAAMVDVSLSSNTLAAALRSFQIPTAQAADVMGKLVTAGQRSAGGFQEFAGALTQLGPLAAGLGGNLDEVLGILRLFTNETGSVSEGAVKLRAVFQELLSIDPFTKQGERLRQVLGATVEVSLQTRGLAETLKLIIGAAGGSTEALREMVGSGRTLVAFTRLMKSGFEELNKSVELFANTGARQLTEEYESQKNTISALIKETGKLVSNAVALAFDRNAEAIRSSIKAVNAFITDNRELLSTLVQTGVYLSAGVVAIGAFKLAAAGAGKVITGLGDAITLLIVPLRAVGGLLVGLASGSAFAGLSAMVPKIVELGAAIRGVLFADLAGSAVKAAFGLKVLTDAQLAAAAAAGVARNAKGQFVSRIIEVGDNVVTTSTKINALRSSLAALAVQVAAGLAVFGTFLLIGREIGKALFNQGESALTAGDAWQKYHQASALSQTGKGAAGLEEINNRLKGQSERVTELVGLYNQLAKAKDAAERKQINERIVKVQADVELGKGSTQQDALEIDGRIKLIEEKIIAARAKLVSKLNKEGVLLIPEGGAQAFAAENKRQAETTTAVDALTFAYKQQGKAQEEARKLAEKDVAALDAAIKARSQVRGVTQAQTQADIAAVEAGKASELAISAAAAAADDAEKSIKGLADALEAAGAGNELERRLDRLDDVSKKGRDGLKQLATTIAALDDAIGKSQPGSQRDELEARRADLVSQQNAIVKSLGDIEKAKDRARAEAAAKDQKEIDDQIKSIDAIRVETLRALGLEVEADKAASKAKFQERLRAAEELRKSTIKNAGQLADLEIDAANRAYNAEIANIDRLQKEKEDGYATAQAARQKAEDDAKRAALLAEAAELASKADAARKRGDLRLEQNLREKIRDLIQQAGSRSAELLEKERDLRQTAKERLDLIKQEVDTRLRLGEGGAGIVDATRKGLRDIAGAESASDFRGAVRGRLGQTQTEAGAKELFGVIKQLLEAEFVGLGQQANAAQKAGDKEGLLKAQLAQRDVAERYRILNDELKRTIGEIKKGGGKPADAIETPTLVPGSQVRPDEKVPANVRVIGPATKDKAQIEAADAARKSGAADELARPVQIDTSTPLPIDDSTPIRVFITNPDSQAGFDPGPLVGPPAQLLSEPVSEPEKPSGGVGPLGFIGQAVGAASLAASVAIAPVAAKPVTTPSRTEARAGFEDRQEASRGAALNSRAARARAEADARIEAVKRTSTPEDAKKKIEQINKAHDEQFGTPTSPNGFRTSKIDIPDAPGTPGESATAGPDAAGAPEPARGSPTPAGPVPDASGIVKQTLDAVAGAAKGLQTTAGQLLDAIKTSGDATVSAIGAVNGKLTEAVGQLNTVTAKVKAIEDSALALRIEGKT